MRLRNTLGGIVVAAGNMNNIPPKPQFFRAMFVNKHGVPIRAFDFDLEIIAINNTLTDQGTTLVLNKANVGNLFHSRVDEVHMRPVRFLSYIKRILRIKMNITRVIRQWRP